MIYETDHNISFVIADDQLICCFLNGSFDGTGTTCIISLETGEILKETQYGGYLTYDGTYVYIANGIDENPVCFVCDRELNEIDVLESGFDASEEFVGRSANDSTVYFTQTTVNGNKMNNTYHVYRKADIGKEDRQYYETEFAWAW